MKKVIKYRWLIAGLWIVTTLFTLLFAPDLQKLVAEKGQITVPGGYTSQEANDLMNQITNNGTNASSAVLVFHQEDGLSEADKNEVAKAIDLLEENAQDLGISEILSFKEATEIEELTVSEDKKTIMVPFQVSFGHQSIEESRANIYQVVQGIQIEHHVTGETFIEEDIIINSEKGLEKTLYITVALILIILFIVFRSLVAPLVPLLTVGVSYLVAQGIVAVLADTVNFPLSTFTQIFMVAVMFGIGTDYCILLIGRFKEEIPKHQTIKEAVLSTYKASGKTVFFAGLAVLIGFSTIGLSQFSLYQSAVAVAVGVAVVLIALVTLVPFLLVILGKKLFWPFDKQIKHQESKIWGAAGLFAWTRPVIALCIIAIITVPALISYDNNKSYDSLAEIGDDYGSVIGFNWIADSFGPGQTMPTTVVMETDKQILSTNDYQDIEKISQELANLQGVKEVRSATRPAGEVIDDFSLGNQADLLADGVRQSTDGLSEIQKGLQEAADELKAAEPQLTEAKDGVDALMQGTQDANAGIGDIHSALTEIQQGIADGSKGAGEIKAGLQTIKGNLDKTIEGNKQLLGGYKQIKDGLSQFGGSGSANLDDLDQLIEVLQGTKNSTTTMRDIAIQNNPDLAENEEFLTSYAITIGQIDGVIEGVQQIKEQLGEFANIQEQLQNQVVAPLNKLNQSFAETIQGQEKLAKGLDQLITGITELEAGLNKAADGQGQVAKNIPNLQDGLAQIYGGQKELKTAFADMDEQLSLLSTGLGEGSNGLGQINDSLIEVKEYLDELEIDSEQPITIIPEEAMNNEDFIEGTKPYISTDKKIVKWDVVLADSPYSTEAIQLVGEIKERTNEIIPKTVFANSDPKIGGVSSTNTDLQNISDADYTKTAFLMVAGIFIILIVLLKSLVMPIYLLGSLLVTYFTSMAFAEIIFVNILGYDGLTWANPFFSLVMLVALGIDYSIFLMARFNENPAHNIKDAMLDAMKNMGTVIISATIILGGTFGAMLPSGVLSLLQIATVVLIGLFLYAFVILPLFIPVMVRLFGKHNWWPFKHR